MSNFSVGFQNLHGLHDCLGCKANRLESKLENGIEIWCEVWGCECNSNFENYDHLIIQPQKHIGINKGRKSGQFYLD